LSCKSYSNGSSVWVKNVKTVSSPSESEKERQVLGKESREAAKRKKSHRPHASWALRTGLKFALLPSQTTLLTVAISRWNFHHMLCDFWRFFECQHGCGVFWSAESIVNLIEVIHEGAFDETLLSFYLLRLSRLKLTSATFDSSSV